MSAPPPLPGLATVATRRKALLGGMLLGGAGFAALVAPRRAGPPTPPGTLARVLPAAFGAYNASGTSKLILPPASDLRETTYADLVTRAYASPRGPVYLLAACASAKEAGLTVHRAEDCYPAFGFSVSPLRRIALGTSMPVGAEGCFFTARRGDRIEHVLYWVRIESTFPASPWDQRLAIARANLNGALPVGILFRLSVFGGEEMNAIRIMKEFNGAILAAGGKPAQEVLLGQA